MPGLKLIHVCKSPLCNYITRIHEELLHKRKTQSSTKPWAHFMGYIEYTNIVRMAWWMEYTWWRRQMEAFSALLALCAGNSPVPVNSPHKGQWRGALMFSLICARINDWVNNREAGDLRRHRGHCDVSVMKICIGVSVNINVYNHVYICIFISRYNIPIFRWKYV